VYRHRRWLRLKNQLCEPSRQRLGAHSSGHTVEKTGEERGARVGRAGVLRRGPARFFRALRALAALTPGSSSLVVYRWDLEAPGSIRDPALSQ